MVVNAKNLILLVIENSFSHCAFVPCMHEHLMSGETIGWPNPAVPSRAEGGTGTPVPLAGGVSFVPPVYL